MSYTVHLVRRDGKPDAKVLLTTDFYDIATEAALALARQRYREDAEITQRILEPGVEPFVICDDGRIHSFVQLQREERKVWRVKLP